jgi:hypothetical protein
VVICLASAEEGYKPRPWPMISFTSSVVPPKIVWER